MLNVHSASDPAGFGAMLQPDSDPPTFGIMLVIDQDTTGMRLRNDDGALVYNDDGDWIYTS